MASSLPTVGKAMFRAEAMNVIKNVPSVVTISAEVLSGGLLLIIDLKLNLGILHHKIQF